MSIKFSNIKINGGSVSIGPKSYSSKLITLRPNGAGFQTMLSSHPSQPNWINVSDIVADDDASYNLFFDEYEDPSGFFILGPDLYSLPSPNLTTQTINNIKIYARCLGGGTHTSQMKLYFRDDISNYAATDWITINGPWTLYDSGFMFINPRTGLPWTISQINALQIGIAFGLAVRNPDQVWGYVTQMYVEVNYS